MDYLKNHKKITQAEYIKIKDFIIVQLKSEDTEGVSAVKAISNVKNLLYDNFIKNNIVEKHFTYFSSSYNAIVNHTFNYGAKQADPILKTLETVVFENFNSTLSTFKIHNLYQEDFKDLTFEKFYPELLKLVVYKKSYSRLENSIPILMEAIKLFFDTDNYEGFCQSLLQDDEDKITIERITKIFKKYGRVLKNEAPKKVNGNEDKDLNRYLLKYKDQIAKFEDNEKALLLSFCVRPEYNLPSTEKIKLILISGSINNDYSIFEEAANKNTLYNDINKGINRNMSKKNKIILVAKTLEKIKIFNLDKTNETLKSIETNLKKF
ncbi:MAG: hypothetical protein Q7T12_00120 [Flavobacterium sp.]|nr:hypothetical protein [Flavobacterium sp.]